MAAFALIIGILGIYFSSAFVRLEIFGSISVIILSSIGISILISKILKEGHKPTSAVTKISFLAIIVALLMVPMVYPEKLNWSNNNDGLPITILNSGSSFDISTNDWSDAMQWLRENTPKDAVIASWWDYGYWIGTLAERKTLADNSTLLDWQIRKIAAMYMSTPENAWQILTSDTETNVGSYYVTLPTDDAHPTAHSIGVYDAQKNKMESFKTWKDCIEMGIGWNCNPEEIITSWGYDPDIAAKYPTLFDYWISEVYALPPVVTGLDADYVIVNLAVQKLSEDNIMDLYILDQKGGDETKSFWFMKIADLRVLDYYNPELTGYSGKFWDETLLGKLIPFTHVLYVDPNNPEIQSETYKQGYTSIYVKNIKFPMNGDGPFQLVYVPPSFEMDAPGPLTGPLIYKINKEYNPNQ
jgi:dolichyl-diphosphooligosaccharide--protein glycosyltransferase